MKYAGFATAALASLASVASAIGVVGKPEGFAAGTTGGGNAAPVYPTTTAQLVSYLGDSTPRVIVLTKTFDFTTTEGSANGGGCLPWGTGGACQVAIDKDNWCENYEASAAKTTASYYKAGSIGINVASNKSLIGQGSAGIIKGKGLRMANGAKNIIIQNIQVSDINARYVWGGDAITLAGTDLIWIDHVTTARVGRQHIVLGNIASGRVTISNHFLEGASDWSATCDGHTYWAMYFTGANDMVTLKDSYIHYTSGRAPKVSGNTILHAVNNYWYENSGHAFEVGAGAYIIAEGNVFQNVVAPVEANGQGKIFASPSTSANTACKAYLGHNCELNAFGTSGSLPGSDTSFFSNFQGKTIAVPKPASQVAAYVKANAGIGKLKQ